MRYEHLTKENSKSPGSFSNRDVAQSGQGSFRDVNNIRIFGGRVNIDKGGLKSSLEPKSHINVVPNTFSQSDVVSDEKKNESYYQDDKSYTPALLQSKYSPPPQNTQPVQGGPHFYPKSPVFSSQPNSMQPQLPTRTIFVPHQYSSTPVVSPDKPTQQEEQYSALQPAISQKIESPETHVAHSMQQYRGEGEKERKIKSRKRAKFSPESDSEDAILASRVDSQNVKHEPSALSLPSQDSELQTGQVLGGGLPGSFQVQQVQQQQQQHAVSPNIPSTSRAIPYEDESMGDVSQLSDMDESDGLGSGLRGGGGGKMRRKKKTRKRKSLGYDSPRSMLTYRNRVESESENENNSSYPLVAVGPNPPVQVSQSDNFLSTQTRPRSYLRQPILTLPHESLRNLQSRVHQSNQLQYLTNPQQLAIENTNSTPQDLSHELPPIDMIPQPALEYQPPDINSGTVSIPQDRALDLPQREVVQQPALEYQQPSLQYTPELSSTIRPGGNLPIMRYQEPIPQFQNPPAIGQQQILPIEYHGPTTNQLLTPSLPQRRLLALPAPEQVAQPPSVQQNTVSYDRSSPLAGEERGGARVSSGRSGVRSRTRDGLSAEEEEELKKGNKKRLEVLKGRIGGRNAKSREVRKKGVVGKNKKRSLVTEDDFDSEEDSEIPRKSRLVRKNKEPSDSENERPMDDWF